MTNRTVTISDSEMTIEHDIFVGFIASMRKKNAHSLIYFEILKLKMYKDKFMLYITYLTAG